MSTNKTQILQGIRLRKFTTVTLLKNNYNHGKLRPIDDTIIPQVCLFSVAWEPESDPSLLVHRKIYRHPITIENTNSRDSVTHRNVDDTFPRMHKNASHSNADTMNSDTHSSQGYVNAQVFDTHIPTDARTGIGDTSNLRKDSNL